MVACAFNPSTWEAETGRSLRIQGQPGLHSEFQASWSYRETLSQKEKTKQQQKGIILAEGHCHGLPKKKPNARNGFPFMELLTKDVPAP